MDGDRPALRPDGRPDARFAFFTRDRARIIDTWHSLGLRGTGSHDIEVTGLRIPVEHSAAPLLEPARHDGALWQLGFFPLLGLLMSGFPLGVARRALDEVAALASTKRRGTSSDTLSEDAHVQYDFGRAEAMLESARALVLDAVGNAWNGDGEGVRTRDKGSRVLLAAQQAMDSAIVAVDAAFGLIGSGAVYNGHSLERCFRDLHTAKHPHRVQRGRLQGLRAEPLRGRDIEQGVRMGSVTYRRP